MYTDLYIYGLGSILNAVVTRGPGQTGRAPAVGNQASGQLRSWARRRLTIRMGAPAPNCRVGRAGGLTVRGALAPNCKVGRARRPHCKVGRAGLSSSGDAKREARRSACIGFSHFSVRVQVGAYTGGTQYKRALEIGRPVMPWYYNFASRY